MSFLLGTDLHASILVVDDSEDTRLLLGRILARAGYSSVRLSGSALEAQAVLRESAADPDSPWADAILLDVVMPDVDGISLCRALKADRRYEDVPILMMTAETDMALLEDAFAAGAHDFVRKPFGRVELLSRLRAAIRLKREMDIRKVRERQLAQANEALERLSALDGLTGVPNRRTFDEHLAREWRRAAREKTALSLLLLDVDHFKLFNDHYGHQAGDDCLVAVAQAAAGCARRPADLVARYGGEEFGVILPATDEAGATSVAQAVNDRIRHLAIPHARSGANSVVTVSIGVATAYLGAGGFDALALLRTADRALYGAKEAGRDRFHLAGPLGEPVGA